MSPNSYTQWNEETGLLEGFQGEALNEQPIFKWTYSVFEEYLDEAVTPSMYHFMAGYVDNHLSREDRYELQGGDYCAGTIEEEAVDAYFALSIHHRIESHEQELVNLVAELERASDKEVAFINASLDDACPFDLTSPIYVEYCQWCRSQKEKWTHSVERLENMLREEENWVGGHEAGESDAENYDPTDEY